jgi:hypothetical protein
MILRFCIFEFTVPIRKKKMSNGPTEVQENLRPIWGSSLKIIECIRTPEEYAHMNN